MAKKSLIQKTVATAGDVLGGWPGFRKSLDANDIRSVEDFLLRRDLLIALAEILVRIRPKVKELEKTIAAGEAAENPFRLEDLKNSILAIAPQTVADAEERDAKLTEVRERLAKAEAAKSAAELASKYLLGLHSAFAEITTGEKSKPLYKCGVAMLPDDIYNALNDADLGDFDLGRSVWTVTFLRRAETPRRRRLVAAGGQD